MGILFLPEQWKCCTKWFPFPSGSVRTLPTLDLWLWLREGAKENELLLAPSFPPFHVIIFGTSGDCQREVTRVERGHDWVPWSFMFPTTPPESRFSNGKPCPWGSRLPRFAHRNLCSCCIGRTGCEPGVWNSEREHPAHAPRPVRFYVKKHKFKMKIFKNFKQLRVEPQPSVSL